MATPGDVAEQAGRLPFVVATDDVLGYAVHHGSRHRGLCWSWKERLAPGRPRVPNPGVLAVRVADLSVKEELLAADPEVYFTEPHYDGFAAVLVRLDRIDAVELGELLTDAWRCTAPASVVRELDPGR